MAKAQFTIGDEVFEFPTTFRLGDAVLVQELTGVSLEEIQSAPETLQVIAFLGVAVWQAHPQWKRDRVIRFIEQVDTDKLTVEGDSDPPARAGKATSPAKSDDSTTIQEA